jgi:hypothetical protein
MISMELAVQATMSAGISMLTMSMRSVVAPEMEPVRPTAQITLPTSAAVTRTYTAARKL